MADNIQISDLKFDEIKNSLVNYLKTTSTFKDFDFEGSAIRTLIDLLAYNTFYYGYYSNMMANEMFIDTAKLESSLISLTKPLGYVLINSLSAYADVRMDNLNSGQDKISAFSKFSGYDTNGLIYYFYNIKDVDINEVQTAGANNFETNYFSIYEAKFLVYRQQVSVDLQTQQFLISGLDVDPRTIVIEVRRNGILDRWENYLVNDEVVTGPSSKLFFIERKRNGYMVLFGKQSETEESFSSISSQIETDDEVLVSYLVSSGEAGNNISAFSFISDAEGNSVSTPTTDVVSLFASKSGRSSPDLDSIRFFAPKSFASQNRLVTKGDYYAILNQLGYGNGSSPDFDFKIFGGEEATPPYYGRVFVSIIDLNPIDPEDFTEINQINEVMAVLKSKSVVGILPEYVPPMEVEMKLQVNGILPGAPSTALNARKTSITNAILQRYSTKRYNNNVIQEEIKDLVRQSAPGVVVTDDGIFLYAGMNVTINSNEQKIINFKNMIRNDPGRNVEALLLDFDIRDFQGKLYKYRKNTQTQIEPIVPVGEVNYDTGVVVIYSNLGVVGQETFRLEVACRDDNFYAKDQLVPYIQRINLKVNITSV